MIGPTLWTCRLTMPEGDVVELESVVADGMIPALVGFAADDRYIRATHVMVEEHEAVIAADVHAAVFCGTVRA